MKTELDSGSTWFLCGLTYDIDDAALLVDVREGATSDKVETVEIGGTLMENLRAIRPSADGRRFRISFEQYVTWQVVDESYTAFDKSEVRDDTGYVQVLSQSKYLDYVKACHGWFSEARGPARHVRIWTENEVIDVITTGEIKVEPSPPT